ncbi:Pimeloyl-ACP methyl ester carboxylesterase [Amphritea atlantica]|uniref:Pimeloyl-ACP methyl ester carboxylesterase n=1 Tax=Amphritea atlantica TaxID=355243 RepID=A0A1H9I4D7_9GAMM|nr:alpha/beta hydrolase [Amphritea atlantica]SEQ69423.1 Pimeloyl-ACP methyl ester carboxylesterase [Amphritea atlantica]
MLNLSHRFIFEGQDIAWGCMGEGEPLVLIHGTPFSSQVWRKIAPLMARRKKVYFFDLLGYGLSEKREGQDVSLAVQNTLFTALLHEWGIEKPEVLCHDFGGATALRAYYLNGVRYARLTIIDPVAVAPWGSPFVSHVREYEDAFAGLPAYAHDALLRAYLQSSAYSELSEETLAIYMAPWQGSIGQAAFYRQIAQMDQRYTDEIEKLYAPMEDPVQILWGENDEWIPISQGRKLANLLTTGVLTPVPESGHLMQEDAPEAIVAAMFD